MHKNKDNFVLWSRSENEIKKIKNKQWLFLGHNQKRFKKQLQCTYKNDNKNRL